mgnify:CR=1 FL=1
MDIKTDPGACFIPTEPKGRAAFGFLGQIGRLAPFQGFGERPDFWQGAGGFENQVAQGRERFCGAIRTSRKGARHIGRRGRLGDA